MSACLPQRQNQGLEVAELLPLAARSLLEPSSIDGVGNGVYLQPGSWKWQRTWPEQVLWEAGD